MSVARLGGRDPLVESDATAGHATEAKARGTLSRVRSVRQHDHDRDEGAHARTHAAGHEPLDGRASVSYNPRAE
jgi:hypothetical protein